MFYLCYVSVDHLLNKGRIVNILGSIWKAITVSFEIEDGECYDQILHQILKPTKIIWKH